MQAGFADVSRSDGGEPVVVDTDKLMKGSLYSGIFKSGSREILLLFYFIGLSLQGDFERTQVFICIFRKLFGQLITLSGKIWASISTLKYSGVYFSCYLKVETRKRRMFWYNASYTIDMYTQAYIDISYCMFVFICMFPYIMVFTWMFGDEIPIAVT